MVQGPGGGRGGGGGNEEEEEVDELLPDPNEENGKPILGHHTSKNDGNAIDAPTIMDAAAPDSVVSSGSAKAQNDDARQHQLPESTPSSPAVSNAGPVCANCSTQTTSLWRRSPEGQTLCNACSLYQKMKGTPRPVSLKTNVIKHRNRSKGDKKLKDGGVQQQQAKGTAPGGTAGKGKKSTGPKAGAGPSKHGASTMEGVVEEDEEDDEGVRSQDEEMADGINSASASASRRSSPAHPVAGGPMSHSSSKRPPSQEQQNSAYTARQKEYAAAATLAGVSNSGSANGRSISVDPRPGQQHQATSTHRAFPYQQQQPPLAQYPAYAPLPYHPLFVDAIARDARNPLMQQYLAHAAASMAAAAAASQPPSASTSASNSPNHLPQHHPPGSGSGGPMPYHTLSKALAQSAAAHQYRNFSPDIFPKTNPPSRSQSRGTTPSHTPLTRSPVTASASTTHRQYTPTASSTSHSRSGSRHASPQLSSSDPASSQQYPPHPAGAEGGGVTPSSRSSGVAGFQLSPGLTSSAGPHRSASTDRHGASASFSARHGHGHGHGHAHVGMRTLESAEEERHRHRDRLEQLFAASGSQAHNQQQQHYPHSKYSYSEARQSAANLYGPGYKPYELPSHRMQPRSVSTHALDSRHASQLSSTTTNPSGRPPSSSASSSGDSRDGVKKGMMGSLRSPPLQPYVSPPLSSIADNIADSSMAIDGEEERDDDSPPFGQSLASERRGRSTTRKAREGEQQQQLGDSMAYGLEALRMRDSSRQPSPIPSHSPHHYALPTASSIKTADIDDGIVRNALTHRPVSDLRASNSPVPTTLPSLSSALSSSASSRSISDPRSTSRTRRALATGQTTPSATLRSRDHSPLGLPLPNSGFEEVARLRTRIQELEFINGLMEARVAELEAGNKTSSSSSALPPHGHNCRCRCNEQIEAETQRGAEQLKDELAMHGIQGLGEKQSRDLFDLLHSRLGYQLGDLSR